MPMVLSKSKLEKLKPGDQVVINYPSFPSCTGIIFDVNSDVSKTAPKKRQFLVLIPKSSDLTDFGEWKMAEDKFSVPEFIKKQFGGYATAGVYFQKVLAEKASY